MAFAMRSAASARSAVRGETSGVKPVVAIRSVAKAPRLAPLKARYLEEEVEAPKKLRQWPEKEYVAEVLAAFPDKMIANVEEARVLYESGYKYLDVRPALEIEETGKVPNSINVPLFNAKWQYNTETKKKECKRTENADFMAMIEKKFPKKDTPLLVACSDGKAYSMDALEMLDEAGYTHLVGLKGGYYAWFKVFDNKLGRRYYGEYAETYTHDGDSCGIHASGAGFEKVDKIENWGMPKF